MIDHDRELGQRPSRILTAMEKRSDKISCNKINPHISYLREFVVHGIKAVKYHDSIHVITITVKESRNPKDSKKKMMRRRSKFGQKKGEDKEIYRHG